MDTKPKELFTMKITKNVTQWITDITYSKSYCSWYPYLSTAVWTIGTFFLTHLTLGHWPTTSILTILFGFFAGRLFDGEVFSATFSPARYVMHIATLPFTLAIDGIIGIKNKIRQFFVRRKEKKAMKANALETAEVQNSAWRLAKSGPVPEKAEIHETTAPRIFKKDVHDYVTEVVEDQLGRDLIDSRPRDGFWEDWKILKEKISKDGKEMSCIVRYRAHSRVKRERGGSQDQVEGWVFGVKFILNTDLEAIQTMILKGHTLNDGRDTASIDLLLHQTAHMDSTDPLCYEDRWVPSINFSANQIDGDCDDVIHPSASTDLKE